MNPMFSVGNRVRFTSEAIEYYSRTNPEWMDYWSIDEFDLTFNEFTVKAVNGDGVDHDVPVYTLGKNMSVYEFDLKPA